MCSVLFMPSYDHMREGPNKIWILMLWYDTFNIWGCDILIIPKVIVMVGVFCFCWTPYATISMAAILGHGKVSLSLLSSPSPRSSWSLLLITFQNIPLPTTVLPLQFAKSAIVWNPVIYLVMNPMVVIIVIIIALYCVVIIVIIVIVIYCIILNISINISSGAHSWRVYPNDLFQTQWEVRWIRLTWRWKSLYCLFVSMFNNINEKSDM